MSYDSILGATGQGYQTFNQDALQQAQMPTFADKFLAGLRTGQQTGMAQQMQMANMNHLAAQNQNYKDQRVNQEMGAAAKYATPENASQFSQRIQDLGGPQIDFSQGGSEHQKRELQTKIAGQKNQIASDLAGLKKALNEAQIKKMDSQIPLIEAQIRNLESKSDYLDQKGEVLFSGDNPMYGALVQSQINRNNMPPPSLSPSNPSVIRATTDLNSKALARATSDLKSAWMFKSPADRAQLLMNGGADAGTAKVLATSALPPMDHPAIQKVLSEGTAAYQKTLSTPSPLGTTPDQPE